MYQGGGRNALGSVGSSSSESVVLLEGQLNNDGIPPCLLYLHCDPHGSEEIVGLGILSEARNMEVYIGEEYYATGRGEKVITFEYGSKKDKVTLYKKYLGLECSTASCKIKLLSLSEKQRVLISKIIVHVKSVCTKSKPVFTELGSGIDLDKVQTIMESVGSKLSPGAQQLLDMVRFQQKNGLPFGGKLQNIFGKNGFVPAKNHSIDGLEKLPVLGRLDHLSNGPSFLKANSAAGTVIEDLKLHTKMNKHASSMENMFVPPGLQTPQSFAVVPQSNAKGLASSFLQDQGKENPSMPNSTLLLPLLQTVCGQVNHLRIDERSKQYESNSGSEDRGIQSISVEQQPVCLYLEKLISKNMELMEKRLMENIDLRIQKLQEYIDNRTAEIMDLVLKSNNDLQEHNSLREKLKGERVDSH
ncbi:hypothetical protein EYD10_14084 [Varanus komodoensis]|nr:hypothetical protein EYD10_14084 [Varanus komodoensis]